MLPVGIQTKEHRSALNTCFQCNLNPLFNAMVSRRWSRAQFMALRKAADITRGNFMESELKLSRFEHTLNWPGTPFTPGLNLSQLSVHHLICHQPLPMCCPSHPMSRFAHLSYCLTLCPTWMTSLAVMELLHTLHGHGVTDGGLKSWQTLPAPRPSPTSLTDI